MKNNLSVDIAKKELKKIIINELCRKNVIDFCQCNSIIKKLDDDVNKLNYELEKKENMENLTIKIFL